MLQLLSSRQIADWAPFKVLPVKQEYSTSTPLDVLDRIAVPLTGKGGWPQTTYIKKGDLLLLALSSICIHC